MKHAKPRALPHPLLTPLADDVKPNIFELSCPPGSVAADDISWKIAAQIHHQCPALQSFVERGLAKYGVHVECPRTFYRQWFPQESAEIKLSLPVTAVRGRVELLAFCVAAQDIEDYRLPGQHADYNDSSFEIRAGDYLAIARHVEFDAFLDLDPIRKISSILDVRKSSERTTGPAEIFLQEQRIEVWLSQDDFRSYVELRTDPSVRGLLANSVVFPAVLQAINYLAGLSGEALDEAKADQRWCRSLAARLENGGVYMKDGPEKIYLAAQQILKEPVRRGLSDLIDRLERETV